MIFNSNIKIILEIQIHRHSTIKSTQTSLSLPELIGFGKWLLSVFSKI